MRELINREVIAIAVKNSRTNMTLQSGRLDNQNEHILSVDEDLLDLKDPFERSIK
jgi:hypothetical protein